MRQKNNRMMFSMKKDRIMIKLLALLTLLSTSAQTSCEKESALPTPPPAEFERYATDLTMHSDILDETIRYSIYLPADYTTAREKRYGVVYLLHGYGDDHKAWNDQWLHITTLIDSKEQAGEITPMIYVMPQGFNSYYVNRYDGEFDYMDMFAEELVPYIDRTYRTTADRSSRAVVGYSMGGFGAMILASKHPELFSVSIPLSMSFRTDEQYMAEPQSGWNGQWGAIFGGSGLSGEARLTDYYKEHCPFYFFNEESAASFANIRYYFDCGDDEEQLLIANDRLHRQLRDLGIAHEYRVRNGAHTSDYWHDAMREGLNFIEIGFHGGTYPDAQEVATDAKYDGTELTQTIAGVEVCAFPSKGYDASKSNSVVYFVHDGMSTDELHRVMNLWNVPANTKPFVVVCVAASQVTLPFAELAEAIDATFGVPHESDRHFGVGRGAGASVLYTYASETELPLAALYLFDGNMAVSECEPSAETYYYIDTTDEGRNYVSAGELYEKCKAAGVAYDYRVRNGVEGVESSMGGFLAARNNLLDRMKN